MRVVLLKNGYGYGWAMVFGIQLCEIYIPEQVFETTRDLTVSPNGPNGRGWNSAAYIQGHSVCHPVGGDTEDPYVNFLDSPFRYDIVAMLDHTSPF
jgi:hypothetical protein